MYPNVKTRAGSMSTDRRFSTPHLDVEIGFGLKARAIYVCSLIAAQLKAC